MSFGEDHRRILVRMFELTLELLDQLGTEDLGCSTGNVKQQGNESLNK